MHAERQRIGGSADILLRVTALCPWNTEIDGDMLLRPSNVSGNSPDDSQERDGVGYPRGKVSTGM
jgi:hypothetical protein